MVFRNEQELRQIVELYESTIERTDDDPRQRPFIETVVFENSSQASMSWYLPDHELTELRASLGTGANCAALDRLIRLWGWLDR